jgi:hypothetical protein
MLVLIDVFMFKCFLYKLYVDHKYFFIGFLLFIVTVLNKFVEYEFLESYVLIIT